MMNRHYIMTTKIILSGCLIFLAPLINAQQEDALQLYRQGEYRRAIQICQQELQDPERNQISLRMNSYVVMGWSYLRVGDYSNALSTARNARRELRYDIRIIAIEGEALYHSGQYIEALSILEEYVSLNDKTPGNNIDRIYYFMGEIFINLSEYEHATIALETAIYYSPDIATWWVRLGFAREQILDLSGAEKAYVKALELQPALESALEGLNRIRG